MTNQGSNNVSVLLGNGDGTFQAAVNHSAGGGDSPAPRSLVVGDFNSDGVADLAVASDTVSVLLGNGDGTFQAAVKYAAGLSPNALAVADLNGDGKPDLAVAVHQGEKTFNGESAIFFGDGRRSFTRGKGGFRTSGTTDVALAGAEKNLPAGRRLAPPIGASPWEQPRSGCSHTGSPRRRWPRRSS